MDFQRFHQELADLLADESLLHESNLLARLEAIAYIHDAAKVLRFTGGDDRLRALYSAAKQLQERLETLNADLVQRVRVGLQAGRYTPQSLRAFIDPFTPYKAGQPGLPGYEYDSLDCLLERTLLAEPPPAESRPRQPGMIRYEATPARIVLEFIDTVRFLPADVFIDIGSGLGLVVMLVHLLAGVKSIGIEYDPAYCGYAQARAAEFKLSNVAFLNLDARLADFGQGNVFFMFTPVTDSIFDEVLEKLRQVARRRTIQIGSYGTCTYELAKLPWLQILDPASEHDFRLAIFTSR
jgi:hypothetical protein